MRNSEISMMLSEHYARTFAVHGRKPEGVDWGASLDDHRLRLERMLAVTELGIPCRERSTLLDVGCGFGSLLDLIRERAMSLDYQGIDMCEPMIAEARKRHPDGWWLTGDFLQFKPTGKYDYVVCNGILTQKLNASIRAMNEYAKTLITKMFEMCTIGIAFNVMSTHVNFMADNLYYRNPVELLAWCMTELTPRARLDHAYPLYEYTIYLYREDAPGLAYGAHRTTKGTP